MLAAHLWQLQAPLALAVVAEALAGSPGGARRRDLLAFLSFAQLQDLAVSRPEAAPAVVEQIFAAALRSAEPLALAYLEPLLDLPTLAPACAEVCRASLADWHAGVPVSPARLTAALSAAPPQSLAAQAEHQRQRLLELLRQRPTMTHNYYRLRQEARARFLEPLTAAVQARDAERAWRQWQAHGSLDDMVAECVAGFRGRRPKLEQSHYQQTRRYLETFATALRHWRSLGRPQTAHGGALTPALAALREAAERSPACASFLQLLQLLPEAPDDARLPPPDFGQRCTVSDEGELLLLNPPPLLGPLLTWSWPLAVRQGTVPVGLVLSDWLRQALGTAPATLPEAVAEYVRQDELLVAREVANGDAALRQQVTDLLEKKKQDFATAQATLLQEAGAYRAYDPNIADCLREVQHHLDDFQLAEAAAWVGELDSLVQQFKASRDPERLAWLEILREAGRPAAEDVPREVLKGRIERLLQDNDMRRLHVLQLEKTAASTVLPEALRKRWLGLARAIDRPACWPAEETSLELEWAVEQFRQFLEGQVRDRDSDPERTDLFVERFAEWVPDRFRADPTFAAPAGGEALDEVRQLARDIAGHAPERRILQRLGAAAPGATSAPSPAV